MKPKLILFAFTLLSAMLFSQAVPMAFEDFRTNDGTQNFFYKNVVKTDASGNIYTLGATTTSNSTTDILLSKKNSAGITLWTKQINGTANSHDFGAGLLITTGGDVYLTGAITNNTTTLAPDLIVRKYNSSGTQQFSMTYTASGHGAVGKDIVSDGTNCYITGAAYNSSYLSDILTLAVTNSSGTVVWADIFDYTGLHDGGVKIGQRSGKVTVTGGVTYSTNNYKIATLTYTAATGVLSESVAVGSTMTSSVEIVTDMTTDASGNTYLCGAYEVSGQGYNYYLAKLTSSLTIAWEQTYNSSSNLNDVAKGVKVDASGNVYVTGVSTSSVQGKDIRTIKYNSSGTLQWNNVVNSTTNADDEGFDMEMDNSSNIYIAGYKSTEINKADYYTIKYNSSGTTIWEKLTDGISLNDKATNIALDSLNNVIITGESETDAGVYRYMTVKYVQQDITNPVDLLTQPTNKNFGYHQNRGQVRNDTGGVAPSVMYYTHNQYPKICIEKNSYNYVYTKTDTVASTNDTIERINVGFTGANSSVKPYGYNPKTYPLHYFLGHVGEPVTNVSGYDRLVTQNIYPNIDLHYYSNSKGFKYYFVVKPDGNPANIKFRISGAISTTITSNNLFINGVVDDITLKRPYAYMVNSSNVTTTLSTVSWVNTGSNDYEFSVPTYTTTQTLIYVVETENVASPTGTTANLEYSTYYGKGNNDIFNDIRVLANGDRYVVGNTDGSTFPVTPGAIYSYKGLRDAVVLKYSVTKDSLVFATFYGGGGDDLGNSVDVNSINDVFIGGQTFSSGSNGIPIASLAGSSNQTANGMSINPSGASPGDGFIARLHSGGNVLIWSRYYGGSQDDGINSIYIDNADNLYFAGQARSNDITMVNAAQSGLSTSSATNTDAIVGKFNGNHTLIYSTYLGGGTTAYTTTKDVGRDITADGSGNAIVVGTTDASNFPVGNSTGNANTFYDASLGGYQDGFIVRYSSTGTKQFASYFGGAETYGIDEITRVNYNKAKNEIYFAGQSNDTTSFPYVTLSGAFNLKRKATNAAFIASMAGDLTKQWCSSYGKAASNFSVTGLASDTIGIIYLTGQAKSNTLNYPVNPPLYTVYNDTIRNGDDGFVTIFNPQKNLFHSHYFGGSGNDYINNAYVGANNKLYVVGNTSSSTGFPIAYNSVNIQHIDSTFGGGTGQYDGFITRFDMTEIQAISVKETSSYDYMFNVYPNPSTSGFVLEMKADDIKNVSAKVYNLTGQVIVEQKITQPHTQFYCESWASGVYLINVNANGKLKTFKLIKN